jgi:uncharacterized RDD family membrane protein YckC
MTSLTRRALCLLYEALLLVAVWFASTFVLLFTLRALGHGVPRNALQAYLLVVAALYFVPQWRHGQTLPLRTWRIRLVAADGGQVTWAQAVLRYAAALLTWLTCGAGFVWAAFDRDRQFLHDRVAGTRLISVPR